MAESYADIPELSAEQAAILRRKKIAEAIRAQSLQPLESQQAPGGYVVPTSPLLGIGKVLEAYLGKKAGEEADTAQLGLGQKAQEMGSAERQKVIDAMIGQQEQPRPMEGFEGPMPGQAPTPDVQSERLMGLNLQFPQAEKERELRLKSVESSMNRKSGTEDVSIGGGEWQTYVTKPDGTVDMSRPIGKPFSKKATASESNVNIGAGEKEYVKERLKKKAEYAGELDKSAESAYKSIKAMDRFLESSKTGMAGGAQPIISGTQNFLASFGFDIKDLKDVNQMEQAIGDILATKMSELGARGLTDRDMDVLKQSLPRVATDRTSRENIAEILKRSNKNTIAEWENYQEEEAQSYPELKGKIPRPQWYKKYKEETAFAPVDGAKPSALPPAMPTYEDYDSLKSGTEFTDPDGKIRKKP